MSKVADRNQRQLLELLKLPGNDVCADCRAKNPRWAVWDTGIFVCVSCASLHRKMGTHISKVKSLTLDTWSREQVEHMRSVGNVKSNLALNPNGVPPPTSIDESERGYMQEKYVREKYEERSLAAPAATASSFSTSLSQSPELSRESSPTFSHQPSPSTQSSLSDPSSVPAKQDLGPGVPLSRPKATHSNSNPIPVVTVPEKSTPSPDRNKHVHFSRSVSVPIPDVIDPPIRVPSAAEARPPSKGILRPRSTSNTLSTPPNSAAASWNIGNSDHSVLGSTGSYNPFTKSVSMDSQRSVSDGQYRSSPNPFLSMSAGQATSLYQAAVPPASKLVPSSSPFQNAIPSSNSGAGSSIWDNLDFLGGSSVMNGSPATTPLYQPNNPAPQPSFANQQYSGTPSPASFLRPQQTGYHQPDASSSSLTQHSAGSTSSFIRPQSTGYHPPSSSLQPQLTGYKSPSPLQPQLTGLRKGFVPTSDFGKKEFADLGLSTSPGSSFSPPYSSAAPSNSYESPTPTLSQPDNNMPSQPKSFQQYTPLTQQPPQLPPSAQPPSLYPSPGFASPGTTNGTNPFFNMSAALGAALPAVSPLRPQASGYNPFFQLQQPQQNGYPQQQQPQYHQQFNPFLQGNNHARPPPAFNQWGL